MGVSCKCSAAFVALFAVFIGSIFSGHFQKTGVLALFDRIERLKGSVPGMHVGTPWGFTESDMPDLTGETHLVTGGNVGLGYWSAHHLAKAKATVILACRSERKCEDAAQKIQAETGTAVATTILDLSSFKSIRACAASVAEKYPVLDGLMLNAGVGHVPFALTEDGIESVIGTNHFGHFLLTKLLLPQLEAGAKAKGVATVVAVSSAAHFVSYPEGILPSIERMNDEAAFQDLGSYGQSKLANVLFAQELAVRLKDKNILANSVHPGAVVTDFLRTAKENINAFCKPCVAALETLADNNAWRPKDAALSQVYALVGPELRSGKTTGKYFVPIARQAVPSHHAFDEKMQKHLWQLTEDFIASH